MALTRRQRELLDFLVDYIRVNDVSPTYEEIRTHFGYSSLATVHSHVHRLSDMGMIRCTFNRTRSIEILRTNDRPRRHRSVRPPGAWLCEDSTEFPISPLPEDRAEPMHVLRRSRERWKILKELMLPGDHLRTFRSPPETWRQSGGRAGYAMVRNGEVVDGVLTWDDLDGWYVGAHTA